MYIFYERKRVRSPHRIPNIWPVIFITAILLLAFNLPVRAKSIDQRVTLSEKNTPLKKVFDKISEQTGYDFLVSTENLKLSRPVTISVQREELRAILDKIFLDQPLAYIIQEKMIIVYKKGNKPADIPAKNVVAPIKVTGQVADSTGTAIPGAKVTIRNSNQAVLSDAGGQFTIDASDGDMIEITYIGYEPVSFKVKAGLPIQKIVLHWAHSKLNEIQIIGYGQTSRRLNTGDVNAISASVIEQQPVSNPLEALQGRAPGVLVQTQNGLPGGNIKIQIRGQGSIASGTDPLYIIDGVPFLSAPLATSGSTVGANGAISPFSILNPSDIERVDILKDADATAIYGSRAANGVVLITTKKGAVGKQGFSVNVSEQVSRIARFNQFLDLHDYLQIRREAFANDKITPTFSNAPDLLVWDTTKTTDWQKYFLGGTARVTDVQAGLTGGDGNNRYLLSANYHHEGTIFPGDEYYQKGGGYLNFDHSSKDRRFNFTLAVNYNVDNNHTLYSSITNSVGQLPPDFPAYNADGTYNWDIGNPVAALEQKQQSTTDYLNVNTVFKYTIGSGLNAKVSLGYNNYLLTQVATLPQDSQNPVFSPIPTAYFATNLSRRYIIEPQLDYTHRKGKGVFSGLLGATYQNVESTGSFVEADNVSNPTLLGNLGAAGSLVGQNNSYSLYKFASLFGRLNYQWDDKYVADFNLRRDGSSRFGPGNQFGNFWALGAGWIFSEESLMKDHLSFLSYGKLRSSYGTTGNDQISDYQYLSTYSSAAVYGGISSLAPARVANPDYSWETTTKLEGALELGFLKDRLLLTAAWYRNKSSNQLISYKIPYLSGFASYQANFPAVIENTGWELELNAEVFKGPGLNWKSSFNISLPQNKLLAFPNLATSSYATTYVVGQDLSTYRSYQFTGVDPQTGVAQFTDLNHDGKLTSADYVVLGKTSPTLFGGWSNTIVYKSFSLDFLFEFVKRSYKSYTPSIGASATNSPAYVLARWQQPGDITDIPKASVSTSLANYNVVQFTDASYIRLKNLAVSYAPTGNWLQALKLKSLKFYVNAENLFVIANHNRFDPEISGAGSAFPPLRTIATGIKLNF